MTEPSVPYRESRLFRAIPAEVLQSARIEPEIVECDEGSILFEERDAGDGCYIVESGSIRISKTGDSGDQETLDFIGPGGFFGEMSLYNSAPRSARATAATPARLARLNKELFDTLRRAAPLEMTAVLAEVSIERLVATDAYLIERLRDAGRLREVGAALGTVAHNVRSPLGTIRNAADLLIELLTDSEIDRAQALRFVEIIRRTTTDALETSEQLLAQVRGETRANRLHVPIDEVLATALRHVAGMIDPARVTLESDVSTHTPVLVELGELCSAVANVLRNAVESLPSEGGFVRLSASDAAEGMVLVTISDNGCGIAPEKIGRIFDFRYTDGKRGGTGIGLSHVRAVCRRHGGEIRVTSEPGVGSTFFIELPAASSLKA